MEEIVEVVGKTRKKKQVLDDLEENTGYWKLEKKVLDRTVWRTRTGRGGG
jgi:hypothetical protein